MADVSNAENIFLFVPNLIGYARIVLGLVSFYFMPFDHVRASICYLLSGLLDAFDGYAARYLNQSTKFGAILDQITDRCALLVLLTVLCGFYPRWALLFQLSMVIDISSHWIHIWASMMQGKTSHKFVDPSANPVLKIYYTSRPVLFTFCAANEIFYCGLYLLHFTSSPIIKALTIISAPISILKTAISLIQLTAACINVGIIDVQERQAAAVEQKKGQ